MEKALLSETMFRALPLGSVKPAGWLLNQLHIQAEGLTGHLHEHWKDVGPDNGWLGGEGDSWERGPYYLDGLLPLAYLLEDDHLIAKVQPWIEWTLQSQKKDGSFGPSHLKTVNTEVEDQDWWQDFIMLKVLTQYEEVTHDERVIPFMLKYCHYLKAALLKYPLKEWAMARGADLLLSIQWLYERTGEDSLIELAEQVREQTMDWSTLFDHFPFWRKQKEWDHRIHVVNVAMGIKAPAVFYRQTQNDWEKESVYKGIKSLMTYHGQAHGMFSGDEWLSGTHPSQGVELCAVVEYMFSMENLVRILGDGKFADILEKVAFNALPATISPDWDAHQYDQQVNQIICNAARRPWINAPDSNIFGLEPNFGCCTSNMHQGWPKFVASLWMATQDKGLAAISYAPCQVVTTVAEEVEAQLDVKTDYPFREQVSIKLTLSENTEFPMYLRVPEWCEALEIKINEERQQVETMNQGFAIVKRLWHDGDCIEVTLPMQVQFEERNNLAVSVTRGPLVYALPLGEQWVRVQERERFHDWEIYPKKAWHYALLTQAEPQSRFTKDKVERQPFALDNAPIKLIVKGRLISNWIMENNSAGDPPLNPIPYPHAPIETLELIPYGAARLRIAEFPALY
ncbi:hypothetical protein JOD43_003076 [Pullulanibacillus pueri]|uniref:DUF1680 family protein n=1 Tax=Pullulanibacillus pueri TaxID=1437324 RepID=A0A8J2ZY25_9BACL|nr:beta-L-arabinofuranosidase domain-containing protein [Pullulanibacillus pueri]MBM7682897.1 hypothetical protein [Pullulanibacillus pueri]GGH84421.1 hypothetical protein GCM10007096_27460 [Pullulanibacillus pueri]